jgi:hypothetical protein
VPVTQSPPKKGHMKIITNSTSQKKKEKERKLPKENKVAEQ